MALPPGTAALDFAGMDGIVERAGDDLGVGGSVVQHLFLDGLCACLQRAVDAGAELQRGGHVRQVVFQVVKALHLQGQAVSPPPASTTSTAR